MKQLMPWNIIKGDVPEYEIDVQQNLQKLSLFISKNIPESLERNAALAKLQEASFWLVASISQNSP